jgi:hypothetical protein
MITLDLDGVDDPELAAGIVYIQFEPHCTDIETRLSASGKGCHARFNPPKWLILHPEINDVFNLRFRMGDDPFRVAFDIVRAANGGETDVLFDRKYQYYCLNDEDDPRASCPDFKRGQRCDECASAIWTNYTAGPWQRWTP